MMWEASAPSNIALVKYMGKKSVGNIAINPSLSLTLDHLRTFVQLEVNEVDASKPIQSSEADASKPTDSWEPHPNYPALVMTETGRAKYLAHLQRMKDFFGVNNMYFTIRSGNNFPADCGIASSASSFAALTLATAQAFSSLLKKTLPSSEVLADLSRQGSGSSCRSFFPGFVAWTEQGSVPVKIPTGSPLHNIYHQTVIASGEKKSVSSSQAHERVQSSLLMAGREERAQKRFDHVNIELQKAQPQWSVLFEETWAEFWDMHALFETSVPSFGYMQRCSMEVLQAARKFWQQNGDGPLVTMDAGPNVHLLWRAEQKNQAQAWMKENSQWQWLASE